MSWPFSRTKGQSTNDGPNEATEPEIQVDSQAVHSQVDSLISFDGSIDHLLQKIGKFEYSDGYFLGIRYQLESDFQGYPNSEKRIVEKLESYIKAFTIVQRNLISLALRSYFFNSDLFLKLGSPVDIEFVGGGATVNYKLKFSDGQEVFIKLPTVSVQEIDDKNFSIVVSEDTLAAVYGEHFYIKKMSEIDKRRNIELITYPEVLFGPLSEVPVQITTREEDSGYKYLPDLLVQAEEIIDFEAKDSELHILSNTPEFPLPILVTKKIPGLPLSKLNEDYRYLGYYATRQTQLNMDIQFGDHDLANLDLKPHEDISIIVSKDKQGRVIIQRIFNSDVGSTFAKGGKKNPSLKDVPKHIMQYLVSEFPGISGVTYAIGVELLRGKVFSTSKDLYDFLYSLNLVLGTLDSVNYRFQNTEGERINRRCFDANSSLHIIDILSQIVDILEEEFKDYLDSSKFLNSDDMSEVKSMSKRDLESLLQAAIMNVNYESNTASSEMREYSLLLTLVRLIYDREVVEAMMREDFDSEPEINIYELRRIYGMVKFLELAASSGTPAAKIHEILDRSEFGRQYNIYEDLLNSED